MPTKHITNRSKSDSIPKSLNDKNTFNQRKLSLLGENVITSTLQSVSYYDHESIYEIFSKTIQHLINQERYGIILNRSSLLNSAFSLIYQLLDESMIRKLFIELKKWDGYTFKHAIDVFVLGVLYSRQYDFKQWELFAKGCLLHDIGKLSIPQDILQKPSTLSKNEFEMVKNHTVEGEKILQTNAKTSDVSYLANKHHERLDGSGYPEGIYDQDLDPFVKALMVIDVFSAMTLDRPYQAARSSLEALSIMAQEVGKLDQQPLKNLMQMLHIFPAGSIVQLSTGEISEVLEVPEHEPYCPKIINRQTNKVSQIPHDFSVHVNTCIALPLIQQYT